MRYLYINEGAVLELRDEPPLKLDRMHALLGGYIEEIWSDYPVGGTARISVLDNEDGLHLNLAPSVRFPRVYSVGGVLRGCVIIMAIDDHGEQTDLTDTQLSRVAVQHSPSDYPTLHIQDGEG
jgi:hypothetical protein